MSEETRVLIETTLGRTLWFTSDRLIVTKTRRGVITWSSVAFGAVGVFVMSLVEKHRGGDKNLVTIPYTEITKVELFIRHGVTGIPERGRVTIAAGAAKHEFQMRKPKKLADHIDILRAVLADKLTLSYETK